MPNVTVSTDIDTFMQSADKAAGRSNLGAAASGANTDITSVSLTSGSITTAPTTANHIVNKTYADSIGSGINFHDAADYGTIAVLSPAATYNQPGGAGVGVNATLTGSTNVPLVVDGVTVATGKRILVKNQGSAFQNGIYTVTQQGNNATIPYILTRASDYDTSGSGINEVQAGDFVLVLSSTLANTAWVQQTPAPINFGVTAINFTQFAAAAASVTTFSADATGFTPATATNGTVTLGGTLNVDHGGTGQTTYTDGQLLIGNTTGNTLAKSALTAGTGMTVTNGSGAITLTAKGLGAKVKTVGIDAVTIQGCINLCTDADGEHSYTVLIPPIAGSYTESLTLKGSVSLVGLTTPLNADAVQITGAHTFTPASAQANTNRINFQNLTFISSGTSSNTITCSSSTKYFSKFTFSGCIFSGDKSDTYSHLRTDDNVAVYVDNCRFESSAGGSASAGITQGNGPLYLSNNTTFDVYGRALDVPASTTTTRTATVTAGSTTMTLTSGTTTGLAVGMRISGANVGTTLTIVSLTAPSTVIMSSTPKTSGSFIATFGQTPYVEIHDSVLAGKGAETVRLGNGLLTCNTSNFTNTASGGSGINMLTANTVVGMINSSFAISDATAYTITAAAATCYAALESVSFSNSFLAAYSTLIGANVTVADYTARATSIENGGTGAITRQAAINALAGAVTASQVLAGNGTNITLRALLAADIPNIDTGKLTTGTLPVARGGTGTTAGIANINTTQIASLTTAQTANLIPQLTTSGLLSLAQIPIIPAANGGTGTTAGITAITTTQLGCLTTAQVANFVPQLNSSGQIYTSQIATLNQNTTGTAAGLSATLAIGSGGTGQIAYTDGQLLIGNTATGGLSKASLTAGSNITITPGNGSITIAATGSGLGTVTTTGSPASGNISKFSGATSITPAVAGTDYSAGTAALGTGIIKSTATTGALTIAIASDFPTLNQNTTGTAANVTGTVAIANGGTGATSQLAALTSLGAVATSQLTTAATASGVPQLTTSGLLSLTQIGTLTSNQVAALTTTQLACLTTAATANLVPQLTAAGFLSTTQLATVAGLPVTAIGSSTIVPTITVDTKGRVTALTTTSLSGLTSSQLGCLTTGQVASFVPQLNASGQIYTSQIATLNQNTTGTAAGLSATLAVASGGTGAMDAATARTNLSAATFSDVQIFSTNGTWTKPAGAKSVNIQLFGAGGGGGGGRKDSGTLVARSGGGAGGGGSYLNITIPASALSASESVTIGAGGAGGAGATVTGNGTAGTKGGDSIFNLFTCLGGGLGAGGSSTGGSGGPGIMAANSGGNSSITAAAGKGAPNVSTSVADFGGAGGGAGGGLSITDAPFAGGDGGRAQILNQAGGLGGAATGVAGAVGYTNSLATTGIFIVGSGGGGGGASTTTSGGDGGAGGFPAGGGGGGGATISGTTSGAGAAGANGLAIITTYF